MLHKLLINHSWNKTNKPKCYESTNLSPSSPSLPLLSVTAAIVWAVLVPLSCTAHADTHAKDATGKESCTPCSSQSSCPHPDCLKQGIVVFYSFAFLDLHTNKSGLAQVMMQNNPSPCYMEFINWAGTANRAWVPTEQQEMRRWSCSMIKAPGEGKDKKDSPWEPVTSGIV